MSITLPSDIVSDVIDAARPTESRAALDRLARLQSATNPVAATEFAEQAAEVARTASSASDHTTVQPTVRPPLSAFKSEVEPGYQGSGAPSAYRKFEGFVLQVLIESMLPKDESAFGKGTAGVIWRSMLAEQLGTQLAAAGGIGIAKMLNAAHPADGEGPNRPAQDRPLGQSHG